MSVIRSMSKPVKPLGELLSKSSNGLYGTSEHTVSVPSCTTEIPDGSQIGSGALKVLAMDQAMCLPFKVSTTTSNFMIGVTAAASAGIYLARGYVDPGLAMPVVLGVLAGATLGARVLATTRSALLRVIFAIVVGVLGVEMIINGFHGRV